MINFLNRMEKLLFGCRWILAPMYYCLIAALLVILCKFGQEFWHIVTTCLTTDSHSIVISVLQLVDVVLVGNLLVMIIFSGYENFVSKINIADHHVDRPPWMGKIDYGGLKQKIIGSIVAISSIELLKLFIELGEMHPTSSVAEIHFFQWKLICMGGLHGVFVVSGLIFAFTEKESEKLEHSEH